MVAVIPFRMQPEAPDYELPSYPISMRVCLCGSSMKNALSNRSSIPSSESRGKKGEAGRARSFPATPLTPRMSFRKRENHENSQKINPRVRSRKCKGHFRTRTETALGSVTSLVFGSSRTLPWQLPWAPELGVDLPPQLLGHETPGRCCRLDAVNQAVNHGDATTGAATALEEVTDG